MNHIPKLRGSETDRIIWRGIVDYANADFAADRVDVDALKALVVRCLRVFVLADVQTLKEIQQVQRNARETGRGLVEGLDDAIRYWGGLYQPEFRNLLTWLCSPNENRHLGPGAVRFLQVHSMGIQLSIDDTNDNFDLAGNDGGFPIFFWTNFRYCDSIMSPICKFLVDRISRFQDEELELVQVIPIRICDRKGCNRFKLPERQKDRCFCSDACRATDYQSKKSPEEKASYMRKYRKTLNVMSGVQVRRGRRKKI